VKEEEIVMEEQPTHEIMLTPVRTASKAAILAQCDQLAAAGIGFVVACFDGSGDEGATEDLLCYRSNDLPWTVSEPVVHDVSSLQVHFETFVPDGYEDGLGGFGYVVLNVNEHRITVERNDRFEDFSTSTYEV
jgi:hypothetical protein